MRKIFFLSLLSFLMIGCETEEVISKSDIPNEILTFIETHFPNQSIIQSVKDTDGLELTYDITLEGGYFLEFNRKKELIEIKGISKLPDSLIPTKLLEHVNENYPENLILSWELDDKNQKIKLENGIELVFKKNGDFLKIDY